MKIEKFFSEKKKIDERKSFIFVLLKKNRRYL